MLTKNKNTVHCVQFFLYEAKVYLGASGDGLYFEVFDVSGLSREAGLSKHSWF